MKKQMWLVVVAFLVVVASQETTEPPNVYVADISKLLDVFMPFIAEFIVKNNLDPLPLPPMNYSFWIPHPLGLAYLTTIGLENGLLNSISTLKRNGPASATYRDKVLTIDATFAFGKLSARYDYFIKLKLLQPRGTVTTDISNLRARVNFRFDMRNYTLELMRLDLNRDANIVVQLQGNEILDWLISPITNVIITLFKSLVIQIVENRARTTVREYLSVIAQLFPRDDTVLQMMQEAQILNAASAS